MSDMTDKPKDKGKGKAKLTVTARIKRAGSDTWEDLGELKPPKENK